MANSIVNGIESDYEDAVDVVRLNLLSALGRRAAVEYGIQMVPVTLLFDGQGSLVVRQTGMPDAAGLIQSLNGLSEASQPNPGAKRPLPL